MKKVIFVLFIMLLPINVFAVFDVTNPLCTDTLKENLRKEINNIVYIKEKNINNGNVTYIVNISEIPNEVCIEYNNTTYQDSSFSINNITPGANMSLSMYAKSSSVCGGYKIYTKLIQIPYYNKYKDSQLCIGNEEYFLCKEDVSLNVTEEEFNTMINKYIEDKKDNNNEEEDNDIIKNDNEDFINKILDFIYKYYVYILLSIIFLGTSGIVIILIQKRRNSF